MILYDTFTSVNYMKNTWIIQSIAKTRDTRPEEVFADIAQRAARSASRLLGTSVTFSINGLEVETETFPPSRILNMFRACLLTIAKTDAGLQ